jgi:hypothetical protein
MSGRGTGLVVKRRVRGRGNRDCLFVGDVGNILRFGGGLGLVGFVVDDVERTLRRLRLRGLDLIRIDLCWND